LKIYQIYEIPVGNTAAEMILTWHPCVVNHDHNI